MDKVEKQKLNDSYGGTLLKLWENYIKIIDMLLGLAGATALVFIASIKVTDWTNLPNRGFIIYVFISSGLAMFFGVCWRLSSQHFMEYETIGSAFAAKLYFETAGVVPVTTAHLPHPRLRPFYRICFRFFPVPTGLSLVLSWVFVVIVFFGGPQTKIPAPNGSLDSIQLCPVRH